jgi:serine/threonine-protein kinase
MPLLASGTIVGRYTILGKLATGGMSEVFLARQAGPSGFLKIVVLKVILPQLAEDAQFVQMFQNEAKLAALINHPNVVQIFDFGVEGGVHFMAMEYIDGRNLNRILRALAGTSQRIPVPVAMRITADACGALEFAHSLRDPGGQQLQIIHRDVSLENILVTYTGQVKLVDFGIAKARTVESYTTQGTLKGKYNYMAPETIDGLPLDHRIDIYAMGVVLYRLLLGQMPFSGDNHAQLLNRIMTRPPAAPRQLDPTLPSELERILLRSVEKDREQRYLHAGEMQAELEAYLHQTGSAVMPFHLGQFMASAFPPGSDEDRATFQQLAGAATPHAGWTPTPAGRTGPTTPVGRTGPAAPARSGPVSRVLTVPARPGAPARSGIRDLKPSPIPPPLEPTLPPPEPHDPRMPTGHDPQVAQRPPARPPARLPGEGLLPTGSVQSQAPTQPWQQRQTEIGTLEPEGLETQIYATISDEIRQTQEYQGPTSELVAPAAPLIPPLPPPTAPILADDSLAPLHRETRRDPVGVDTQKQPAIPEPAGTIEELDLPHQTSMVRVVVIVASALVVLAAASGIYYLLSRPEQPSVRLDAASATSPRVDLAASAARPADAATAVRSPDLGRPAPADASARRDPKPDRATPAKRRDRGVPVQPPQPARGLLSIEAPGPAEVQVDGRRVGTVPLSKLALAVGTRRLQVRSAGLGYTIQRAITIERGGHLELRLTPKRGQLRVLVRPWAVVTLDGKKLGTTPLPPIPVYEGPHTLDLENSTLKVQKRIRITIRAGKEETVKARLE